MTNDVRRAFPYLAALDGNSINVINGCQTLTAPEDRFPPAPRPLDPRDYERRWVIGLASIVILLAPWIAITGVLWLVALAGGLTLTLDLAVLLCVVFCGGVAIGLVAGYFTVFNMLKDERKYGQDSCNRNLN